jgi:hypothetical protein
MKIEEKPVREIIETVARECEKAGATKWETTKIIKELEKEEGNKNTIRKKAIELLFNLNPSSAKIMESFIQMSVLTSAETIEPFDRGNITESLLKETNIPRTFAEKISFEVEDKLKDLKISRLSTSLIREMANAKLLEYGQETTYWQYARLGQPVFDAEKKIQESQIARELNWLKKIPKNFTTLHHKGFLYLHFPEHYTNKIFGMSVAPQSESKSAFNAITDACMQVKKNAEYTSTIPALRSFNFYLAQYTEKKTKKNKKEIIENAIRQLNCVYHSQNMFAPVIGIDLYNPPTSQQTRKTKEHAIALAKEIISAPLQKNFEIVARLDSPFKAKLLTNQATVLNCRKEELHPVTKEIYTKNEGIICFIELNLILHAHETNWNPERFLELIEKNAEEIQKTIEIKKEHLKKQNQLDVERMNTAIALFGLPAIEEKLGFAGGEKKIGIAIKKGAGKKITLTESTTSKAEKKFSYFLEKENITFKQTKKEAAKNIKELSEKNRFEKVILFSPQDCEKMKQ